MTLLSLWLASSAGNSEALSKKRRPAEYGGGGDLAGLDEREWAVARRPASRSSHERSPMILGAGDSEKRRRMVVSASRRRRFVAA